MVALLAIVSVPVRSAVVREQMPSLDEGRSGSEVDAADHPFFGEQEEEMEAPLEVLRDPHPSRALLELRGVQPARTWQIGSFQSIQVNVDGSGSNILSDAANEPSMAISPVDPQRIVVGWRQFDSIFSDFREAGVAHSNDGGRTWSAEAVIEDGVFHSDPVLAADADGNFYYFSLELPANPRSTQYHVSLFKSVDGGVTWRPPVDARGGDKEWYVVDRTAGPGRGNFYGSWNRFFSCCSSDDFVRSIDGALSFEDSLQLPPPVLRWGTLAVAPDGVLYVGGTLNNNRPLPPVGHVVARSSNAQLRSETPVFEQVRDVDLGGRTTMGGINNIGLIGQVWIAVDHSTGPARGNVYLLGSVERPGIDPADVMFVRSTDEGSTWSAPIRINDDPSASAYQWFGSLAVAPNGRLDAIWNDTRMDPDNRISQVMYSYSLDAGVTWSANVAVSPTFDPILGYPQNAKLGDYYQLLSDNGGASLVYAATFNGEQDIYFLRIPFDCDGNGIEDDCDIACGTAGSRCDVPGCGSARDGNGDGVPDRCLGGNAPPEADAGPDQIVECSSPAGTPVHLDGSASSDPEGEELAYRWTNEFGQVGGASPTITLSLGTHRITLEVTDPEGETASDEVVVTVQDTTAPVVKCEAAASPPGGSSSRPGRPALPAESGFYRLTAADACSPVSRITVSDVVGSGPYGPYSSGTTMKMTQVPGGQPKAVTTGSGRGNSGSGFVHLLLPGDPIVGTQDGSGNIATALCPLPPKEK